MVLLDFLKTNKSERLTIISKETGTIFDGWYTNVGDLILHDNKLPKFLTRKVSSFDAYDYDHIRVFI